MCGINGIASFKSLIGVNEVIFQRDLLAHRGPGAQVDQGDLVAPGDGFQGVHRRQVVQSWAFPGSGSNNPPPRRVERQDSIIPQPVPAGG